MRVFLVAALCTSLAYAKPQYNYPAPPSGSYGVPTGVAQGGGLGGYPAAGPPAFSTAQGIGGGGGGRPFSTSQGIGVGGGAGGGQSFSTGQGIQVVGGAGGGGFSGGQSFSTGQGIQAVGGGGGGDFSAGQGIGGGVGGGFGGGVGGGTLVQKHIYVHVAPPEPEEFRPQRPISTGQAQKHYKIIFIKAPSYPSYQQQILQQQALSQEKTLVYVLVKKPDEPADITLPTAAPTAPSKPEVYFIRYKAKSEVTGGGAVGGGAIGGGAIGGGATGGGAIGGGAIGGGTGFGGGSASLSLSSGSSSFSQINAGSGIGFGTGGSGSIAPQTSYGPPGQSGPY